MDTLLQDLRYGARQLARNPGFTLIAVLTLALGIGANTAIFSVVHAVLLRPFPYPEPEQLISFSEVGKTFGQMTIAYPNYVDWRKQARLMEELAIVRRDSFNLTGFGEPERVRAAMVSANLLKTIKLPVLIGRDFREEEDRPGGERVTLLTYGFWQRRFGGDPGVLGQTLTLDAKPYTIIGVTPPQLGLPSRVELFVPIGLFSKTPGWESRGNHPGIMGLGRLRPGVTLERAQAEIGVIAAQLEKQYPDSNDGQSVIYIPLMTAVVGDIRPALVILLWAVAFVLLIACANVANLLLARAAARQRELAIRAAIGAGRSRLIRQLLTESVVLAVLGGGLGVLLALWGTDLIVSIYPQSIPRAGEIHLDTTVLAFALVLSVLTGIAFGILPAWQASRGDLYQSLKEGGRAGTGAQGRHRVNRLLVVSQMGLALVLLISAGLLLRSFARVGEVDPGIEPGNLLSVSVSLPVEGYREEADTLRFYQSLLERLAALPGVARAAVTTNSPFVGGWQTSFRISGRPIPPPSELPYAEAAAVTPEYFRTLGMTLKRGRDFSDQDRVGQPKVVIIDDSFAAKHWPGEDPVGEHIFNGREDTEANWITVVGVVNTVRYQGLDIDPPLPQMYFPLAQNVSRSSTVVVRAQGDPLALARPATQVVLDIDPDQPVFDVRTMQEIIDDSVAPRRMNTVLLTFFSLLALLLASVGIYGVISYSVARRTSEIGIRMALGAQPFTILHMVLREGLTMALIGIVLGGVASLGVTRFLEGFLFRVDARDPATFVGETAVLLIVALLACYVPARRAARVDPMTALRYE